MRYLSLILPLLAVLAASPAEAKGWFLKPQASAPNPETLYDTPQKKASFAGCTQLFPQNRPIELQIVAREMQPVALCSDNFAVIYSQRTKTPLVAIEKLNRKLLAEAKDERRTDVFFADPRLAAGGATLQDYARSSYDRGHLAAAGEQATARAMAQSFALTNVVPQDATNNRTIWKKVEMDVRKYARRAAGDVFVFSGPLFNGNIRKIGTSNVWVPSHLFKLVYDPAAGRAWAYILPNTNDARIEKPIDYEEFVRQTGWKLLPV